MTRRRHDVFLSLIYILAILFNTLNINNSIALHSTKNYEMKTIFNKNIKPTWKKLINKYKTIKIKMLTLFFWILFCLTYIIKNKLYTWQYCDFLLIRWLWYGLKTKPALQSLVSQIVLIQLTICNIHKVDIPIWSTDTKKSDKILFSFDYFIILFINFSLF